MKECFFEGLPPEMLLKIFSFVPTKDLMTSTRFVCQRFNILINNRQWWITRIQKECGVLVSESESNCPDFDAPLSFVDCHRENRRWQQFVHSDLKLADGHISTVDAIRLFRRNGQRFCISGSRDRSMKIWDLARIQQGGSSKQWEVTKKDAAHGGWIWYIDTPRDDTFFSSGWDDYLKQWQITPDGLIEMGSLKLRSAVTSSIKMECGLVACSTYAKQISFVDPQDAFRIHQACTFHRAAIITMDVQGEKVYSCGDDKQMIVTDVRMPDKPYLTMKATQDSVQSISVGHGQVVCGTKKGAVKIYEPITMSLITSYRPKPAVQIRQVKHNRGSVIAMWKTQLVKIFTSGTKARVRAETREIGEPSRFDYLKGDFAICGGLGSIMFWPCPEDVGY